MACSAGGQAGQNQGKPARQCLQKKRTQRLCTEARISAYSVGPDVLTQGCCSRPAGTSNALMVIPILAKILAGHHLSDERSLKAARLGENASDLLRPPQQALMLFGETG